MTVVERAPEHDEVLVERSAVGRWWASSAVAAVLVAGGLSVLSVVLGWRGTDTAAHVFRVGLLERDGFHVWNNYWFGGHHTPGYSLLFPVLGSLVGIWTVAVSSAAGAALLFDLLVRRTTGRASWFATLWFAAGTVTNVAIGRLPFALGMAVGLGALLAASHGRTRWAGALSILCAAASPVSGAFLALLWVAWAYVAVGRQRIVRASLAACALGPVVIMSAVYPQGGSFPFRWGAFVWVVVVSALVVLLVDVRVVRVAAVLYAVAAVAAFVLPTPLGSNVIRMPL
ncbi:MAG TPA: hypothetical protein VL916_05030, partial [Ilumatobacteraceae bacterium]|nr:hypothetical protein [Ilumatobacteraceae bacterium]